MAHILSDGALDPHADLDCLRSHDQPPRTKWPTTGEASIEDLRKRIDDANAWRRGGSGPMPDPKILGIDLETVSGMLGILNDPNLNCVEKVAQCNILSMENDKKRKDIQ